MRQRGIDIRIQSEYDAAEAEFVEAAEAMSSVVHSSPMPLLSKALDEGNLQGNPELQGFSARLTAHVKEMEKAEKRLKAAEKRYIRAKKALGKRK
jgi:hypothetical protein